MMTSRIDWQDWQNMEMIVRLEQISPGDLIGDRDWLVLVLDKPKKSRLGTIVARSLILKSISNKECEVTDDFAIGRLFIISRLHSE